MIATTECDRTLLYETGTAPGTPDDAVPTDTERPAPPEPRRVRDGRSRCR